MCKGRGGVWGRGGRFLVNIECYIISMVTGHFNKGQWIFQKLNVLQNLHSKKYIIIRVGAVFLQKQLFLYSILLCIKKVYKSIPVATFVGGIKNFATQDNTYEKWVLSRPGQAEYVAPSQEVTEMDKCSQNLRKCLRSSEIKKNEMYVQRVKFIFTEESINPFSNEMDKTKL